MSLNNFLEKIYRNPIPSLNLFMSQTCLIWVLILLSFNAIDVAFIVFVVSLVYLISAVAFIRGFKNLSHYLTIFIYNASILYLGFSFHPNLIWAIILLAILIPYFFLNEVKHVVFSTLFTVLTFIYLSVGSIHFNLRSYFDGYIAKSIDAMLVSTVFGLIFVCIYAFLKTIQNEKEKSDILTQELVQKEKLSSIGMLATGVAHQLGNSLNIISNGAINLKRSIKKGNLTDEKALSLVDGILDAVDISDEIISGIDFSVKQNEEISEVSPFEIAQSAIFLTKGRTLEKVSIENSIDPGLSVAGTRKALLQTFINLILNSVDALDHSTNPEIKISSLRSGDVAIIVFSDNGEGVPKEHINKIFNPFFTTKSSQKGSGVGLYFVKQEVENIGGKIDFVPTDIGAKFIMTFKHFD